MALLGLHPRDVTAAGLLSRPVAFSQRVPAGVIIGRARCGGIVWLLTESRQLVALSLATRVVAVHPVRGLRNTDAPWGLACLSDRTLWTLVSPRAVGRVFGDGLLVEQVSLPAPSIALFGAGTRLLIETLPLVAASAVFKAADPRRPYATQSWP